MTKKLISHSRRNKNFRKIKKKDFDKMVEALFKITPENSKEDNRKG